MGNRCSIQQGEENNCWLEQSPEISTVSTVPLFLGHPGIRFDDGIYLFPLLYGPSVHHNGMLNSRLLAIFILSLKPYVRHELVYGMDTSGFMLIPTIGVRDHFRWVGARHFLPESLILARKSNMLEQCIFIVAQLRGRGVFGGWESSAFEVI